MQVQWKLYDAMLSNKGNDSSRQEAISDSLDAFVDGVTSDPAYQAEATVNGVITPMTVDRKSPIKSNVIVLPGGNFVIGDMVRCFDQDWIVTEAYVDKLGLIHGAIWLCNEELKFQNHTDQIYTYNCVIDDGSYSRRSGDPDIDVLSNTYKVYITLDDVTRQWFVDKRLAICEIFSQDGERILEVYKVTGIDIKSHNFGEGSHLSVVTVQRDVYDPGHDNLEELICDYIHPVEEPQPSAEGRCEIDGKDFVRIGSTRTLTAMFYDDSGNPIDDVVANWEVEVPDGVMYTIVDNRCAIVAPFDSSLVGSVAVVHLSDDGARFGSVTKRVEVISVG